MVRALSTESALASRFPRSQRFLRFIASTVAGLIGGVIFHRLGIPVGWLVGPAVFTLLLNVSTRRVWRFPPKIFRYSIAVVAMTVGSSFSPESLRLFAEHAVPITLVTVLTIVFSVIMALLIIRWTRTDHVTSMLSAIPGGASGMMAMGSELGADLRFIAAVQYLRLISVLMLVPIITSNFFESNNTDIASSAGQTFSVAAGGDAVTGWLAVLLVLPLAFGGAWLAQTLRVPSGQFLGPIIAIVVARLVGLPPIELPMLLINASLFGIGASVGSQFDLPTLIRIGRSFAVSALLVWTLIALCAALGVVLQYMTGFDALTSYLAMTPGGMEVVVVTALDMGADASLVTAVQIIRLFTLIFSVPFLIRWLERGRGPINTQVSDGQSSVSRSS